MAEESSGSLPFRDLVAENFGLLIGYVVPGLAGLWAAAIWDPGVQSWVTKTAALDATIGGFLMLMMSALGVGVGIQALRFVAFERILPKIPKAKEWWPCLVEVEPSHARRRDPQIRLALRELTIHHYRYYQCQGGLAIAILGAFIAWCGRDWTTAAASKVGVGLLVMLLEVSLVAAALDALCRMRKRAADILRSLPIRETA